MQEEIEHKTVNLAISTTKLSARTLLRGMQFLLRQYDKHASQGKQSIGQESGYEAADGWRRRGAHWHHAGTFALRPVRLRKGVLIVGQCTRTDW